jgi:hypothetical protein
LANKINDGRTKRIPATDPMAKKLDSIRTEYLKLAKEHSSGDAVKIFDSQTIAALLAEREKRTWNLQASSEARDDLTTQGFIIAQSAITGAFSLTEKGHSYLSWEELKVYRDIRETLNGFLHHQLFTDLTITLFLLIGFTILDRFASHFFFEKHINDVVSDYEAYFKSGATKIVFLVLSALLITKTVKRHLNKWDFLIIGIYFYFRLNMSHWYFWPITTVFTFRIMYIDVSLLPSAYC